MQDALAIVAANRDDSSVLAQENRLLVPLSAGPRGPAHLILVHASHGTVYDYRHVAAATDRLFPVYGLHSLRQLVTEGMPQTLSAIAGMHVNELLDNGLCMAPFVLYGVSAGGLLGLEIAGQLQARGHAPAAVVLGDTRDPAPFVAASSASEEPARERYLWLSFIGAYLPAPLLQQILWDKQGALWSRTTAEARARYLIELTEALGEQTFSLPLDVQSFRTQLERHRIHMDAYVKHHLLPYSGRSVYLKATGVNWDYSRQVREALPPAHELQEISGNHWALLDEAGGQFVADILKSELLRAVRTRAEDARREKA